MHTHICVYSLLHWITKSLEWVQPAEAVAVLKVQSPELSHTKLVPSIFPVPLETLHGREEMHVRQKVDVPQCVLYPRDCLTRNLE